MLDYLVLAFSIFYIPLLPIAVLTGVILLFRGAVRRKERELLRRYSTPPPEHLNHGTPQLVGFPYEGEREAANPTRAQPEPAGLTPEEEGYADAHRDPENLQPMPVELLHQLLQALAENPRLIQKPGVERLLSAVLEAAEQELRPAGIPPADNPAYA